MNSVDKIKFSLFYGEEPEAEMHFSHLQTVRVNKISIIENN